MAALPLQQLVATFALGLNGVALGHLCFGHRLAERTCLLAAQRGVVRRGATHRGNVGIGGDPVRLLERVRALLADDGVALVELHPGAPYTGQVRLEGLGCTTAWFPWALVDGPTLTDAAADAGLRVAERWTAEGRPFAALRP